jgi:hypothetical protein
MLITKECQEMDIAADSTGKITTLNQHRLMIYKVFDRHLQVFGVFNAVQNYSVHLVHFRAILRGGCESRREADAERRGSAG